MKIGYDAKRAFLNRTGLGNYSRWLIEGMAKYHPDNEYFLYTPKLNPDIRFDLSERYQHVHTVTAKSRLLSSVWRAKGIVNDLKRDGIQLYHGLSHELPLGIKKSGIKSVVTVHDLIFMRFPQYFGAINCAIYKAKLQYACNHADKIIAISQRTKDDLVELLKIDPGRIEVIYQNCASSFSFALHPDTKKAVQKKYNLPKRFLLNVGTIEPRKNLMLLVKALPSVNYKTPLVVVGKPTKYLEEVKKYIAANHLADRVIFLHEVTFAELPAIYQLAEMFIYPSRYEGFGIPIVEALRSGVAAIGAKGSCLEEAGGPHSLYTNPDDEQELAKLINRVLRNKQLKEEMILKGYEYAHIFDDEKLSNQLFNLYQKVINA